MLGFRADGDLTPLRDAIARIIPKGGELRALGEELKVEMIAGNESGLLAGTDKDGAQMPITLRERGLSRTREGGSGKPLNPHYSDSRSIANFQVDVDVEDDGKLALTGTWPNAPFIRYHKRQSLIVNRPARNIVGIRPATMSIIMGKVREWAGRRLGGSI